MDLPRQLGPFRLHRRLGHGGMAEVFLATGYGASGFEKQVAIKTLLPHLWGDGELQRLLIDEAKLGARLRHRNLVQVHDLGTDEGVYYVCMDYVDGADLGTLTGGERPSVELSLLVVEELALGLEYAHGLRDEAGRPLGVVHRDVSPSNVLVSRAGEVKLADLGIAKATKLKETTRANIRRGKYAYMSPEHVAGRALSAHSDQFGLGVVLVELLTGERPFDGATPAETMDRIREAAPPDVKALDADLGAIVTTCLGGSPGARFEDTAALRRAISAARRQREAVSFRDLGGWVEARLDESLEPGRPPKKTRPLTR